jgi:heat shock protein HslJ
VPGALSRSTELHAGVPRLAPVPALRSLTLAFVAVGLTALAAGCNAPTIASLVDREFVSVEVIENGGPRQLVAGSRISLRFAEANIGANAGCNQLGGTYRIEAGRMVFDMGSQTAMGCGAGLEAQDQWLIGFLDSDPLIQLAGNDLTLQSETTAIRLLDREVAEPDLNIVGPTWSVEALLSQGGATTSSLPEGTAASLVFDADGTIEVNAGCNRGSGSWKLQGGGIEVSDLLLTKMACEAPGAELESTVLGVLEAGALQADIETDVLTLLAGGVGLQLRGS